LQTMNLNTAMPFAAVTFVVAGLASMGLPGFSGFVAELQVLVGAWQAFPALAVLTGLGILVGVAYTVRTIQKSFFAGQSGQVTKSEIPMEAISVPERMGAALLMAVSVFIGLYPAPLLKLIKSGFDSPLMSNLLKGVAS
jgi:NADH-quinone oxidoreductase subunit M